jgi:hypothetical protein
MEKPPKPLAVVSPQPGADRRSTSPQPPRKLGKPGLALWGAIQREYRVTDVGGIELLMQACLAADRMQGLTDQIDADGVMIRTKVGARANPLLKEELAARGFIVRTLARLGVSEEIKPIGRPPTGGIGWRPHGD